MVAERLEVRLDRERRRKLEKLAERAQSSVSDFVRMLIDQAFEKQDVEYRLALVAKIANANVETPPDPEELSRQLNEAHNPGDLC